MIVTLMSFAISTVAVRSDNSADEPAGGGDLISGLEVCEHHLVPLQPALLRSHQHQIKHPNHCQNKSGLDEDISRVQDQSSELI